MLLDRKFNEDSKNALKNMIRSLLASPTFSFSCCTKTELLNVFTLVQLEYVFHKLHFRLVSFVERFRNKSFQWKISFPIFVHINQVSRHRRSELAIVHRQRMHISRDLPDRSASGMHF